MLCLACCGPASSEDRRLCPACRGEIAPVLGLRTPGGVDVVTWAEHRGPARVLVRRLKYEAVVAVAALAAEEMAGRICSGSCLVPVSRGLVRRVRYGVDPARELAARLSRMTGLPLVRALEPPIWSRPHAGAGRAARTAPGFRVRHRVRGAVLVDDVLTTGATLDAAASLLPGVAGACTITAVP